MCGPATLVLLESQASSPKAFRISQRAIPISHLLNPPLPSPPFFFTVTTLMRKHAKLQAEATQRPLGALLAANSNANGAAAAAPGEGLVTGPVSDKRTGEITDWVCV